MTERIKTMASSTKPILLHFLFLISFFSFLSSPLSLPPKPTPWPLQFHSLLVITVNGSYQVVDLWYDFPNGRNFNIIQHQLGKLLYDLEWNNGTSFYYTLDAKKECKTRRFEVGILRPNWLDGANYLGRRNADGFECNVWEKADFITYYEDVVTKRPVKWVFYTGRTAHVMTFEVGAVLEDEKWQAPVYCFDKNVVETDPKNYYDDAVDSWKLLVDGILRGSFLPYD